MINNENNKMRMWEMIMEESISAMDRNHFRGQAAGELQTKIGSRTAGSVADLLCYGDQEA